MLQMLALIALDPPPLLNTTSLRAHRAALLRTLRKPTKDALEHSIVKGQYADYHAVPNVEPESKTETYFALKTYLDHPNWEGVPFYLEHGKGMRESVSEITIRFRSSKHCVCGDTNRHAHPNFVRFLISPHQKIIVRFWVRKPGTQFELIPNDLVFDHDAVMQQEGIVTADAYEEVLNHAICGDQTLFVSNAEQEAAWSYVTSILEMWQDTTPLPYERGSDGPPSAIKEEIQKLFTV
jgi:glucose-6-phosphate 1-dehydrogenase